MHLIERLVGKLRGAQPSLVVQMPDQRVLSDEVKTAIKTALATVLAYGVALSMDWDHAYWAAFAVAFCTLSTVGESLNKGLLRLSGTLLGSLVAVTLIALFPQDRWLFLIGMSIFTGFCTYMMPRNSRWYFWNVAGLSVPLIALAGGANPLNDFQTVITRSEETALGVLSYSLVWLLIWPTSSREALEDAVRRLAAAHRQLAANYLTPTIGETHDVSLEALRRQTTQMLARLGGLLDGAEIDSYEVWEARHAWRSLIHQFSQLTSTSERWRQGLAGAEGGRPPAANSGACKIRQRARLPVCRNRAHAGGASAGARADFCAAEPRRQGDGFTFAVPPGRAPPLSQSPAGNRQAHARSFCLEIGRSGLGGDGKPWRIGNEVYGDRDILPTSNVISRKLSVPNANGSFSSATPSAPALPSTRFFGLTKN